MANTKQGTYETPELTVLGELADLTQSGLLLLGDLIAIGTTIP